MRWMTASSDITWKCICWNIEFESFQNGSHTPILRDMTFETLAKGYTLKRGNQWQPPTPTPTPKQSVAFSDIITKIILCNEHHSTPPVYIRKNEVYRDIHYFPCFGSETCLWVLGRTASLERLYRALTIYVWSKNKEYILKHLLLNAVFRSMKNCIILYRSVNVMFTKAGCSLHENLLMCFLCCFSDRSIFCTFLGCRLFFRRSVWSDLTWCSGHIFRPCLYRLLALKSS